MKTVLSERRKLNAGGVDAISQQISTALLGYPDLSRRDILRLQLSAEEIMLHWMAEPGEADVQLIIEEKGHRLDLTLLLKDVPYRVSPLSTDAFAGLNAADEMLANLGIDWIYQYDRGQNSAYISIEAKRSYRVRHVLTAMALAVFAAVGLRLLAPEAGAVLQSRVIHPLLELCSRFLTAVVSPMMLLAVISGVLSVGSPRSLNYVSKFVCIRYIFSMLVTVLCAGAVCALCFPFQINGRGSGDSQAFFQFVSGIVPDNVLSPLIEGNMLQIVFLGVIIGIAMLFLQRRVVLMNRAVEEANAIIFRILTGFEKALPGFVFFSMLDTCLGMDSHDLSSYMRLLVLFAAFLIVVIAVQFWYVSRKIGVGPKTLWAVLRPTFMAQLSSACSSSAFSEAYDACEKKLGVESKLVGFALPIGTVIHKPLIAAEFVFVISAIRGMTGESMDIVSMLLLLFIAILMSMAYPPVSGGEISCYTVLLLQMGMNANLLAVACTLSALFDLLEAPGNTLCTELQLLLTARRHGLMTGGKVAAARKGDIGAGAPGGADCACGVKKSDK